MDDASDVLLALKPVTFRYKPEYDPDATPQFGLIAEDVNKVDPDLVLRDTKNQIYSVRYEAVNAMLLNEFLKEHHKVEAQNTQIQDFAGAAGKSGTNPGPEDRERAVIISGICHAAGFHQSFGIARPKDLELRSIGLMVHITIVPFRRRYSRHGRSPCRCRTASASARCWPCVRPKRPGARADRRQVRWRPWRCP